VSDDRTARRQRLEVDVDTRLMRVFMHYAPLMDSLDDEERRAMACALRAAYGEGYTDALREDAAGRRCELSRANGYATI
jgi:hypothetical protein